MSLMSSFAQFNKGVNYNLMGIEKKYSLIIPYMMYCKHLLDITTNILFLASHLASS